MIILDNICIEYDNLVLKDINLQFEKNKHYLIMGENGSGKSSLCRAITNLTPYSGTITGNGSFEIILQNLDFYFFMPTVIEEISLALRTHNIKSFPLEQTLDKFNLTNAIDTLCINLSGGQKIRLALLLATISKPDFLILDETIAMNDYQNKLVLEETIKELKGEIGIIEISHDLKRIEQADQVIVLANNKVIFNGSSLDIKQDKLVCETLDFNSDLSYMLTNNFSIHHD